MKRKMKKGGKKWRNAWMKVSITILCSKHKDIKRVVLLSDYMEALENKSRKKIWFCNTCGKRLVRSYGEVNFILKEGFNTRNQNKNKNKLEKNEN